MRSLMRIRRLAIRGPSISNQMSQSQGLSIKTCYLKVFRATGFSLWITTNSVWGSWRLKDQPLLEFLGVKCVMSKRLKCESTILFLLLSASPHIYIYIVCIFWTRKRSTRRNLVSHHVIWIPGPPGFYSHFSP